MSSIAGRLVVRGSDGWVDVARASGGRFDPDPQQAYERWGELRQWWQTGPRGLVRPSTVPDGLASAGNPAPLARQVLAVGMNSTAKRTRQSVDLPHDVAGVGKLLTSLSGPHDPIPVQGDDTVLDVEVGLVLSRPVTEPLREDQVPEVLAGALLGLDIVDRSAVVRLGMADGHVSYLNPGKSRPGFTPLGPVVAGLDEGYDLDDLDVQLTVDGQVWQHGTTRDLLFGPLEVIARLSRRMHLLPGDVVLLGGTGNVPGSGARPLRPGDTVVASSSLLGEQRHLVVTG